MLVEEFISTFGSNEKKRQMDIEINYHMVARKHVDFDGRNNTTDQNRHVFRVDV